MAVIDNTTLHTDENVGIEQEVLKTFDGSYNALADVLGIVTPTIVPAGTTLRTTTVDVTLNATSYTEGDEIPVSKVTAKKSIIDEATPSYYRTLTTEKTALTAGYITAVLTADTKLLGKVRASIVSQFYTDLLAAATKGKHSGANLQAALANVDAELADALENGNDSSDETVHFINRFDAAEYLGDAAISTQTAFGLTYLESFLGIPRVIITSKVPSGTVLATPTANLTVYGIDIAGLQAGYTVSDSGLIGIKHGHVDERAAYQTVLITGMKIKPEVTNYLVSETISKTTSTSPAGA